MHEFMTFVLSALLVGALAGSVAALGAHLARVVDYSSWGALAGCAGALLAFLSFRGRAVRAGELARGVDLEPVAPITAKQQVIKLALSQDEGRAVDYAFLNIDQAQLSELARGLSAGKPFTLGAWTGAGRSFSRSEFEQLRHELISRGLVVWRNPGSPAQGVTLTAAGRAVMRYLAGLPHPKAQND